jgi:hypothetical protein
MPPVPTLLVWLVIAGVDDAGVDDDGTDDAGLAGCSRPAWLPLIS